MTLKKLLQASLIMFCISLSLPAFSTPVTSGSEMTAGDGIPVKTADPLARLQEIKNMDIASLSRAEKRDLRKEVKGIKKEIRANHNGVYLSVGAVIIIVLLLIILL